MGGVILLLSFFVNPVISQKEKYNDSNQKEEKFNFNSCKKDKITGIELHSVCSEYPNTLRRWSIYNPNPYWLFVHYRIDESKIKGKVICPPAGMADPAFPGDTINNYTFIITRAISGENTMKIKYGNGQELETLSNAEKCFVDQKWSLNGNEADENSFLGTKNNSDLKIKTNDSLRVLVGKNGEVNILQDLDVNRKITANNLQIKNLVGTDGDMVVVDSLGNFYTKSIENDTIVFKNIQITDALNIGTHTLHLTGNPDIPGTGQENTIYTTLGDLYIQSENDAYNTILNARQNTGSVGIGTDTPDSQYKLDVNGDINYTGKLLQNGKELTPIQQAKSNGGNLAETSTISQTSLNGFERKIYDLGDVYDIEKIILEWSDVSSDGYGAYVRYPVYSVVTYIVENDYNNYYTAFTYNSDQPCGEALSLNDEIIFNDSHKMRYILIEYKLPTVECTIGNSINAKITDVVINEKLEITAFADLFVRNNFSAPPLYVVNGKVGINTETPDAAFKLDVNGNTQVRGALIVNSQLTAKADLFVTGDIYQNGNLLNFIGASMWEENNGNLFTNTNVGIGTAPCSDAKLKVSGSIMTDEVIVQDPVPQCDYVFANNYKLMPIAKVDSFIAVNKHLPGVEIAGELQKGYSLNKMDAVLLEKIEQLHLYIIEQQKEIDLLREMIIR